MTTSTTKRVTLFMHPDIAIHARAQAVVEDMSLTELVEKALLKYLPKETVIKKVKIKAGLDH
ncbi:MAG: hypothetical protein WCO78_01315 [Candidatus Roizmanbacteria bacterium]